MECCNEPVEPLQQRREKRLPTLRCKNEVHSGGAAWWAGIGLKVCEAQSSIPSTTKRKKRRERGGHKKVTKRRSMVSQGIILRPEENTDKIAQL